MLMSVKGYKQTWLLPFLIAHSVPFVLTRQCVESERKCCSGSIQLNRKTHCHGILEAMSINRTKMGRNGHHIRYFCLRKALKLRLLGGGRI